MVFSVDVDVSNNLPANQQNFLLLGQVSEAKKTKGVRATLYKLASTYLAYHDGEDDAFWYAGDTLMVRLLFESKQNADYFRRRLDDESLFHNTSIDKSQIGNFSITATANVVGKEILTTDYNPDDYDSPLLAVSMISGAVTILDSSRPLFVYQRIESDTYFGMHYKAESCHIIENAYYTHNPQEVEDTENNRLALTSDAHNWFDGRNADAPLFKLTVHLISRHPIPTVANRYEVKLLVKALDEDSARLLFPRLKEGTIFYNERKLEAMVSVYVMNPEVFRACIEWKSARVQKEWDDYNQTSR